MWEPPYQPPARVRTASNLSEARNTCLLPPPSYQGWEKTSAPSFFLLALSLGPKRWRRASAWKANPIPWTLKCRGVNHTTLPSTSPENHGVLVCEGCYNKIRPQTGWLILNSNVFLTDLRAESSRSGCRMVRQEPSSGEQTSCCISTHGGKGERALWVSLYKALILFMRAPPLWPKHLPKGLPTNAIPSES